MTQIHWAQAVSGNFTIPSKWVGDEVPGFGDDAILDAAGIGPYTAGVTSDVAVGSIQTAANATLSINGHAFRTVDGTGVGVNAGTILVGDSGTLVTLAGMDNPGIILLDGVVASRYMPDRLWIGAASPSQTTTFTGGGTIKGAGYFSDFNRIVLETNVENVDNHISGSLYIFGPHEFLNDKSGSIGSSNVPRVRNYSISIYTSVFQNDGYIDSRHTRLEILSPTFVNNGQITGYLYCRDNHRLDRYTLETFTNNGTVQSDGGLLITANTIITNTGVIERFLSGGIITAPSIINTGTIDGISIYDANVGITNSGLFESKDGNCGIYFNEPVNNTGTIIGNGNTLTLKGTFYNSASGLISAAQYVYIADSTIVGGSLTVGPSARLVLRGSCDLATSIANQGTIEIDSLRFGDQTGVSLTGAGSLTMTDSANNSIVGAGYVGTLTNVDNVISGAGFIGGSLLTIVNQAKGVIDATGTVNALILDGSAGAIANAGLIESTRAGGLTIQNGSLANTGLILARTGGVVVIDSAVANAGRLEVFGGTMTLNGAVTGSGLAVIAGGTIDIAGAFAERVKFLRPTGVLELAQSQSFTGAVFDFSQAGGTALDLRDIGFVGSGEATFSGSSTSGVLTVSDGTHTASIKLIGNYTTANFVASSDGAGGTTVVAGPAALRFTAVAAGMGGGAAGATSAVAPPVNVLSVTLSRPVSPGG